MSFFYIKIGGVSMPAGKKGFKKGQASFSNRARRTNKQIADDIKNGIKNAANIAMEETAHKAVEKFIDDATNEYIRIMKAFYADYHPEIYKRNYTFLNEGLIEKINISTSSSVSGGIQIHPEYIEDGVYKNIFQSKDGSFKPGDSFPGTNVFEYAFTAGIHGGFNNNALNTHKFTSPNPQRQMDKWAENYIKDKKNNDYVIQNFFIPKFKKAVFSEINKSSAATKAQIRKTR